MPPSEPSGVGDLAAGAAKTCGSCRVVKPMSEFNKKRRRADGLQEVCRDCNRESSRRYYAAHRQDHIRVIVERTARRRREVKDFLAQYLRDHPCVDCGASDIRILDFDHTPGLAKRKDVMKMVKEGFGLPTILREIGNCEVRCRNCHAIVTLEGPLVKWLSGVWGGVSREVAAAGCWVGGLDRGCDRDDQLVGMSTVSMRYTVALAVWTPPQMTFAPLTMMLSPEPVTVTSPPWTVLCVPSICDGESWPGTTW